MRKRYIAKIFRTGGSQAIRLPKECQMPGVEVGVVREGERLVLEPIDAHGWSRQFVEMITTPAPEDLFGPREQPRHQDRNFEL
jgi:antitoxin VapB